VYVSVAFVIFFGFVSHVFLFLFLSPLLYTLKEEGTHLDELQAHRLLECFGETMTVREMRTYLRQHGAIGERVKSVPLTHWLIA
jgi:hypothetical protein